MSINYPIVEACEIMFSLESKVEGNAEMKQFLGSLRNMALAFNGGSEGAAAAARRFLQGS